MIACFRSSSRSIQRRVHRQRSGLMVLAALVCLLIVTSIVGSMVQGALRARRQLHAERNRRQAELLLEAGANRAVARLAAEPDFRGDTWNVPAESVIGHGDGRVKTEIARNEGIDAWQLRVVAEYPLGREFPITRSNTFPIPSPTTQSQE
jgi:hypothetical protein